MPCDYKQYPKNWKQISLKVRTRADWKCEWCGVQCRRPGEPHTTHKITLTVAHLDHDPWNPDARLAALCAPCHCRYDLKEIPRKRRIWAERAGQTNLLSLLEQP